MDSKLALVVDDSKSARFALKRMLIKFNLKVDMVGSAPEAIEYLKQHHPNVIFMDHMMPGMDGFEAVKLIKNNPQTAVIPIMMYTSKGGDVYMSQARALGAVGIIRKTIAQVELRESLLELKIIEDIPIDTSLNKDNETRDVKAVRDLPVKNKNTLEIYIKDLHKLMDDQTIELHRSMWLGIESVSNEIYNRLNNDLENKIERIETTLQNSSSNNESLYKRKSFWVIMVMSNLLIISLIINIFLLSENDNTVLAEEKITTAPSVLLEPIASVENVRVFENAEPESLTVIDAFTQWVSAINIEYPYDEVALNDNRLPFIEEIIKKAVEVEYKGRIILMTHAGEFCLSSNKTGNYILADSNLTIVNCEFIGNLIQPGDESTSHLSLSFVNYLSDTEKLIEKGITIETQSLARKLELFKYPELISQTSVLEWNQAAQLNNSITIELEPETAN
jgi:CheY-like chemotaxis protein